MEFNKDLIAASSTPIVLAILSEGDSYGYAIIKRVQELSGGDMEWTDGMLYPVLHRLERLGYIKARWEEAESGRRRKYYRITSQGKAQLAEERRQWQAVDATLRGIWKREKSEIRSTKYETNPKVLNTKPSPIACIEIPIRILNLFRPSCLGFRA
ncbi:MAG: helix-turn-helix transcriptional regulator [Ignavibacteriales bacterium]|nr:helix-turn-helix transcriptional regulator [Ignavibacteriales bacterium]